MTEAIVITPVKDSPTTTIETIDAICQSDYNIEYYVYNDFSQKETRQMLVEAQQQLNFNLIHLEDITNTPSPNYKLVLEMAQTMAIEKRKPLIIVESDVVVKPDTLRQLIQLVNTKKDAGMVGAITVDKQGNYNFPYTFEKTKSDKTIETSHSLSFCCTCISLQFLEKFSFKELSANKDWFDVTISRQSKKAGYINYLAKGIEVLHLPHSSRPWKNLKYTNPLLYYYRKLIHKRDRI
ncbi:Glycosyl transferase family 2 [Mariniphaga anaerophila]|uniref:Glycosyl transferase family 2 n=1 Tax=Mariniphaga anaerophila TaxID=1484053 RepID=A0A1M5DA95_9BACT|nr:glycosyltransferase [Mariniphaga anaerophila]SHF63810.1 Glycosyl transferase family 2 [Mariniphaga anaerophila]